MLQAWQDEMERQREAHGWQTYPRPPVAEWPEAEREAGLAAMNAALKVWGA
jgi:hypothetical protein